MKAHIKSHKQKTQMKNSNAEKKLKTAKWGRLHKKCCDRVCAFKKTLKIIKRNTQRQTVLYNAML